MARKRDYRRVLLEADASQNASTVIIYLFILFYTHKIAVSHLLIVP